MTKDMISSRLPAISKDVAARALICSYFLALGVGLIPGSEVWRLTQPLLPEVLTQPVAGFAVVCLSGLILLDIQRRPAALLLALAVFWSSYLALMHGTGALATFWRDIALVAALLMTAGRSVPTVSAAVTPTTPTAASTAARRRSRPDPRPYRQDFDLARSS